MAVKFFNFFLKKDKSYKALKRCNIQDHDTQQSDAKYKDLDHNMYLA